MMSEEKAPAAWRESRETDEALAYTLYCWREYILSGDENALHRARHKAFTAFSLNPGDIRLCLAAAFLRIDARDLDGAAGLLSALRAYKGHIKNTDPAASLFLQCARGLLDAVRGGRGAARRARELEEAAVEGEARGTAYMLAGYLRLESAEDNDSLAEAFGLFEKSYEEGERSSLLYLGVYSLLKGRVELSGRRPLIIYAACWAAGRGADISGILNRYAENAAGCSVNTAIYEKIYEACPCEWVLEGICARLLERKDRSVNAYGWYAEAQHRQLDMPGLNAALVETAYANDINGLSRYVLSRFINEGYDEIRENVGFKLYLLHEIITNKKASDLAAGIEKEIVLTAFYCIENNVSGRRANSVYRRALAIADELGTDDEQVRGYMSRMELTLLNELFDYELTVDAPSATHVWVKEKEKADAVKYALTAGRTAISAASPQPGLIFWSEGRSSLIDSEYTLVRRVENADVGLLMRFYRQGILSDNLCLALSRHFIALEKPEGETADAAINVLSHALTLSGISRGFYMQASAALGNVLYAQDSLDKALLYYDGVDENCLHDKYIERMLMAFTEAGETEKAVRLITKKAHCISDRALFAALKRVAADTAFWPFIADAAYELLMKSWFDKKLLDIVLKHYRASSQEWQELANVLAGISAPEEDLDAIILDGAVWMHALDQGSQRVFCRMFERSPDNPHIDTFAQFCCYEMLINLAKPEYDTITALEKLFLKKPDSVMAYALCTLYLTHGIHTLQSDDIIDKTLIIMEEERVLLPIFKNSKDKRFQTPYIMKNLPFIHRCQAGRSVAVYYRADGDAEFTVCPMKYIRFGLYAAKTAHFHGERMTYYFSEETGAGSAISEEYTVSDGAAHLSETEGDQFFTINNAIVYEHMFKYEQVEAIVTEALKENYKVRGTLL